MIIFKFVVFFILVWFKFNRNYQYWGSLLVRFFFLLHRFENKNEKKWTIGWILFVEINPNSYSQSVCFYCVIIVIVVVVIIVIVVVVIQKKMSFIKYKTTYYDINYNYNKQQQKQQLQQLSSYQQYKNTRRHIACRTTTFLWPTQHQRQTFIIIIKNK